MGTTPTEHEQGEQFIPVDPEIFDEIQFKPINKGLGFHKDAKKASVPSYSSASRIKRPLEKTERPMHAPRQALLTEIQRPSPSYYNRQDPLPSVSKTEIGLIYGTTAIVPSLSSSAKAEQANPEKVIAQDLIPAPRWKQFLAWMVDISVLLFGQWVVLSVLFMTADLGWAKVIAAIGPQDTLVMLGLLFSFVYLLYFTVLELGATPGKSLLKLRTQRLNGECPKAWNTAWRALISLLSIPLLGLPLFMDFQGKLSETMVGEE